MPCIIYLLQVTLSLHFHHFVAFWNKQHGEQLSHNHLTLTPNFPHTDFNLKPVSNLCFLVVGPLTLTYQCMRLTKLKLTIPGWFLLKRWLWWHCGFLFQFFTSDMITLTIVQLNQLCSKALYFCQMTLNIYQCYILYFHDFWAENVKTATFHKSMSFSASPDKSASAYQADI